MGTILAVRKNHLSVLASDSANLRDPNLTAEKHAELSCVIKLGDSYIGLNSSLAFQTAFETALEQVRAKELPRLTNRFEVHSFFVRMHELLRNHGFMYVAFQQGQDFEWTPMTAIVANRSGIYRVDSARAVTEFSEFCAMGSGESYALGALAAQFDSLDAEQLARSALRAVKRLDALSGKEEQIFCLRTPALVVAPFPQSPSEPQAVDSAPVAQSTPRKSAKAIKEFRNGRSGADRRSPGKGGSRSK